MRREALRVAIAARIADGALSVIETLDVADGKTKSLVAKLGALGLKGEPTLLVVRELGGHGLRASPNVPWPTAQVPTHTPAYQPLRAPQVGCELPALPAPHKAHAH